MVDTDREVEHGLAGLAEFADDDGTERAEQRRRRDNGGRDRHAFRDRLRRVPHSIQAGKDLRRTALELAGHLRDALCVVRDRSVRIHRDDDADGRQHAHTRERDVIELLVDAVTEQERADDRGRHGEQGPHRGLHADREAGEDRGRSSGVRALRYLLHGGPGRVREVLRQDLDDGRQPQTDQDRVEVLHVVRVEVRDQGDGTGGQRRGNEEATVDRAHPVLGLRPRRYQVDADDGGDDADRADEQRERHADDRSSRALRDERGSTKDDRSDERDLVGLE